MIAIQTTVKAPLDIVWACWNEPEHITRWAFATDEWEAPSAENDLKVGGQLKVRMQAKDGSAGFDLVGTYSFVKEHERIEYSFEDGRNIIVQFEETPEGVLITESFDVEKENPEEMQRAGWQAILDNFKKYVESHVQ